MSAAAATAAHPMALGDNPEDCPVCLTGFDGAVQRPRTLPCGHTVCTLCIEKLKGQDCVTCPECRLKHAIPEGGQFPVSYTIEALIRMMRDMKVAAGSPSLPPRPRGGKGTPRAADKKEAVGLSKKMRSFLQEQEATVVAGISACREAQVQLNQYQSTLTGWGEQQQQLEDRLMELVNQSKSARELVQQEKSHVTVKEEEVKKGEEELEAVRETLLTLTTDQEAGVAVTEVVCCLGEAEQVVKECQECFPDAKTVTAVWKVRETTSVALEAAQAIQAVLETISSTTKKEPRPKPDPKDTRSQPDPEEARPQTDPEEPRPQADPEDPRPQPDPEVRPQTDPEEARSQSDPKESRPQADPEEVESPSDPEELRSQSDPEEVGSQSDSELGAQSNLEDLGAQSKQEFGAKSDSEELGSHSDPEEPGPQSSPNSTIMDRLQLILSLNLRAEDLRSLTQPTRSLLQAGRVFAVHQMEGRHRHARISLEAGQLYLHTLKEQPQSLGAATLQLSEVVPSCPPCTVFLDLSWPGSAPQRVQIHLSPNNPRSRQFALLCTGQRGPSYINTRFFRVCSKRRPGECVYGGDYERNDGQGPSLLLPDLNEGEYRVSCRAGSVFGWQWHNPKHGVCGMFGILTRHCKLGAEYTHVFGEVVEGLDVVAEAAHHTNIMEVTVVDCGMVL